MGTCDDELEAARRTSWLPRPAATHSRIVRTADGFATAPVYTDMESPFVALYRDFAGCVALTIVDESHNAMGENTDIARSIHYAQLCRPDLHLRQRHPLRRHARSLLPLLVQISSAVLAPVRFRLGDMAAAAQAFGVIQT